LPTSRQRILTLATLVLAGEAIFLLPFVLPRVFRPTVLAVFEISNLELGTYYSAYGLVAIGAYLFGGPLADRFLPHRLMAVALASTGIGGLFFATLPSARGMFFLYAAWGLTTILLFWAAMLRATRIAGGPQQQGLAFGILEGGRGLVSALIATLGVSVLNQVFPQGGGEGTDIVAQREGLQAVIYTFSIVVLTTAALVWIVLRRLPNSPDIQLNKIAWDKVLQLSLKPQVWFQALVILCAYSGYRVLDDISLMGQDVLGYNEVEAARLGSLSLFIRPLAAVTGGLLADRYLASRLSGWSFGLMLLGAATLTFGPLGSAAWVTVWLSVLLSCLGVYALRGLYFALTDEGKIPLQLTGSAIGLASVVGYLPDVYMGPLMGWILDGWPGVVGHQLVFLLSIGFALLGIIGLWLFRKNVGKDS